jgi:hypothetical protein
MSARAASWLARSLLVVCLVLGAAAVALLYANGLRSSLELLYSLISFLAFSTVGALISSRRPGNPIGWLFCAVALLNILWLFAFQYALYALVTHPGSLPAGPAMAWLGTGWMASISWGLMATFVPLLFPTGSLPSTRWRPVAWFVVLILTLAVLFGMIDPGVMGDEVSPISNPLGIEGAAIVIRSVDIVLTLCFVAAMAACATSLLLRLRQAREQERQQIKWFAYAVSWLMVSVGLGFLVNFLPPLPLEFAVPVVQAFGAAGIPIATGIAVLHYRLYDIDRIINRTLVYGALTAILVLSYMGCVIFCSTPSAPSRGRRLHSRSWRPRWP